jgi:hypothetical protein
MLENGKVSDENYSKNRELEGILKKKARRFEQEVEEIIEIAKNASLENLRAANHVATFTQNLAFNYENRKVQFTEGSELSEIYSKSEVSRILKLIILLSRHSIGLSASCLASRSIGETIRKLESSAESIVLRTS